MKIYKWYMISTISSKEDTAISLLKNRIKYENLEEHFQEITKFDVPYYEENPNKPGEKKLKYRNLYKGYFFIKMNMVDKAWFVVRNTQYVTGLVGSHGRGTKPTPISPRQFERMRKKWDQQILNFQQTNDGTINWEIGDWVKVTHGPFSDDFGKIIEMNETKTLITVELESVFGRRTPATFEYKNLKKVDK
ncbi:transcription termination/antitermination protein NusG [Mesomycoplasma hyopneumoniae]|uniref:Transcription termination/antitermination protein NusG n=5 Tax=Mesomycoplasma hyopneumoniae TaxID=2099 RepID=Q4A790_MESH7|nr:transcription termination/antitermination protein NusG [Mesomycoplasma hyopneumoniae]AAV28012.1 transcription antitermination protein [Mesomycoplasma hyopneumoniae 232]AAZ53999.1 transcription antitermination protein [Mesomycoplasma hyopneumoniae 7448]ADQ90834.1 Transcription antitermination protein [Mesomycoplasma hyopneumoniae 168]AGM22411.1 Transcription antitermination protein [Mesomycoplasma hyopneumoniae 168-L]ASU14025.1 Transcription termination/antitermination protein NusG [Mesomyco